MEPNEQGGGAHMLFGLEGLSLQHRQTIAPFFGTLCPLDYGSDYPVHFYRFPIISPVDSS